MAKQFNLGIVGLGGFGEFVLDAYSKLSEIKVRAISEQNKEKLANLAEKYGSRPVGDFSDLASDPLIDIIVIITPPFLHSKMAVAAVQSAKHFIVEKPMALNSKEARRIYLEAKKYKVKGTLNYILRYNPIWEMVKKIIDSKVLGNLKQINLTNFASDELLPAGHWFWDKTKSGGIWKEHSVHFFDIFGWLVGERANKVWSCGFKRKGSQVEDRVWGLGSYPGGILVNQYHAFVRPQRIEKTQVELIFEKGYLKVLGWIPLSLEILAMMEKEDLAVLEKMGLIIKILQDYQGPEKKCRGEDKNYLVDFLVSAKFSLKKDKKEVYQKSIQALLLDFIESLKNPKHIPKVNLLDGIQSLEQAEMM